MAQCVEFAGFLGWLRSSEVFGLWFSDLVMCPPEEGRKFDLVNGMGFVGFKLLPSTKTSRTAQVDVLLPWATAAGLLPGMWFSRLLHLGSTFGLNKPKTPLFCNRLTGHSAKPRDYLHQHFISLLRLQQANDPYLEQYLETNPDTCFANNVRFHNLRLSGRTAARSGDGGMRRCTNLEADMHGRWRLEKGQGESAASRYKQPTVKFRISWLIVCL